MVGFASGRIPEAAANKPLIKCFSIIGVRAGETGRLARVGPASPAGDHASGRGGCVRSADRCALRPGTGLDALRALQQRSVAGKIVIEMNP
ncbi:MAG: hypothetical protein R3E68_16550 [Burkholderiaceae bacterium]